MYCTPQQAANRRCPYHVDNPAAEVGDPADETYNPDNIDPRNCCAADCMAWRWSNNKDQPATGFCGACTLSVNIMAPQPPPQPGRVLVPR